MSADNSTADKILQWMTNPLNLQLDLIEQLEQRLLNGEAAIVDPNSPAMHLIEGFSSSTANFASASQRALERRLPHRAQTDNDLFLHMSDYDTVGSLATPSKAVLALSIDKNYVLTRGVLVNNSYRVLEIPADTRFRLGSLEFSIYYPIRIQVDERTQIPLVTYDITNQHPLMALSSNRIVFNEFRHLNYDLIVMYLTLYQFSRSVSSVTITDMNGFTETFPFNDKFYALRVFTDVGGKRIELAQSMVQDNYDASVPTARVQVMQDVRKFLVNIPQVYFTNNMLGPKLHFELLTTQGKLSANVGSLPNEQVGIDFRLDKKVSNPYTDPLKYPPTLFANVISPYTTEGSDGYTYEEKRRRVIQSSFRTRAQITPMDLQNYYADYGIKVERYEDNLTNLIYFIYKPFKDGKGQLVPSTNTYLKVDPLTYRTTSSVKKNPDNTITILPSTWFKYSDNADLCNPLTDDEVQYLADMDKETLADEFNNNSYVRTPFHIRVQPSDTYTYATSYNLLQPKIEKVTVTDENPSALAQMLMASEKIEHLRGGEGGYKITMVVKKDLMEHVPESDILVWLYTTSADGLSVGTKATYAGTTDTFHLYEVELKTSYWIDTNDNIDITTLTDSKTTMSHRIPLDAHFDIVFLCNVEHFPGTSTEQHLYQGVPSDLSDGKMVLLRQSMDVHLGHSLDDVINNTMNHTWAQKQYRRHPVDIPKVYPTNVAATDDKGVPIVETVDGVKQIKLLHRKGDPVIGDDGLPEYEHREGDIWLDTNGEAVVINNRTREYPITAPVFDGRLFVSEHPTQKDFVSNLVAMFETNFQIIRNARGYVTERTNVYFRPSKTIGNAVFRTGNGIKVTMPLDIKMSFRLHVDPQVNTSDELKESVRVAAISTLESNLTNEIISQTDIAEQIKNNVYYVQSVDSLGIDNSTSLQTVQILDSNSQPSIRKKLVISDDNQLILTEDIDFDYVDVR